MQAIAKLRSLSCTIAFAVMISGCASAIKTGPADDIKLSAGETQNGLTYARLSERDLADRILVVEGKQGREQYHFSSSGAVWISRADILGLQGNWTVPADGTYCIRQKDWFPNGQCWHLIIDENRHVIADERTTNSLGVLNARLYSAD